MLDKIKDLAVRLLDDEDGITEFAYCALLDIMPEAEALELNKRTKAMEGRFYLPPDHDLQDWRIASPYENVEE